MGPMRAGVSRRYLQASRRSPLLIALAAGLVVGIGCLFVDVGLACRRPISEACVWGKAHPPLTLGVSVVVMGGGMATPFYAVLIWRQRRQSRDDAG